MCRIGYRNENAQEDYECVVCFLVCSPADPIKDGMPIRMRQEPRERAAMPTTDRWRIKPIKSGGINKKPQLRWAPQCLGKVTSPLDNLTTLIFSCGSAYPFSWREPSLALSVSARKASGPATYVFWDPFSAVSVWQLSSFASEFVASTAEGRKSLPIVTLGTSWPKSSRSNTLLPFVPSSTSLEKGQQSFHPFKSIRVSISIHPWIKQVVGDTMSLLTLQVAIRLWWKAVWRPPQTYRHRREEVQSYQGRTSPWSISNQLITLHLRNWRRWWLRVSGCRRERSRLVKFILPEFRENHEFRRIRNWLWIHYRSPRMTVAVRRWFLHCRKAGRPDSIRTTPEISKVNRIDVYVDCWPILTMISLHSPYMSLVCAKKSITAFLITRVKKLCVYFRM